MNRKPNTRTINTWDHFQNWVSCIILWVLACKVIGLSAPLLYKAVWFLVIQERLAKTANKLCIPQLGIFSYFWYSSLCNWKSLMTLTETLESIIIWSLKRDTSCAFLFKSQSKLHFYPFVFPFFFFLAGEDFPQFTFLSPWTLVPCRRGLHPLVTAWIQRRIQCLLTAPFTQFVKWMTFHLGVLC